MDEQGRRKFFAYIRICFIVFLGLIGSILYGNRNTLAIDIGFRSYQYQGQENHGKVPFPLENVSSSEFISSTDGRLILCVGGNLQIDYRYYNESSRVDNRFDIRRARLFFSGNCYRFLHFRLEFDLQGNDSKKQYICYLPC